MNALLCGDGATVILTMKGMHVDAKLTSRYDGIIEFKWGTISHSKNAYLPIQNGKVIKS